MTAFSAQSKHFFAAFFVLATLFFGCAPPLRAQEGAPPDPVKLFNQGQDAHEKGDFQTALKFYDEAIKAAPEFPEAEYQRGAALVSLGKPAEAEKAFRRAAGLRAGWSPPLASLGALLVEKKDFAEAEKVLTKAVSIDGKNAEAFEALTQLYLKSNASPDVLKKFLEELKNINGAPAASVLASRGAIERALNDKAAAEKNLTGALAIESNNRFALAESIELFISENDFARALQTAQTLAKISPKSQSAKILLARAFAASGDAAEALKILDALDSSNAEVLSLKNSIAASGTQDVSTLEQQLAKDEKNTVILGRLCEMARVSNPPKALDYCRRAFTAEPNNLNHAVGYGAALVQAKQFDAAVALFRKILQIAPDNFTAHANLATALFESKNFTDAKIEYKWLTAKKPDLAIAYYFLAIAQDRLEEYADALENYRQFLSRADAAQNRLEIDKVNLRLPVVQKLAKEKRGKR